MANQNLPFGFNLSDSTSSSQSVSLQIARISSANNATIKKGDPISALSTGMVHRSAAGDGAIVAGIAVQFYDEDFQVMAAPGYVTASTTTGWVEYQPVDQSKIFQVQANASVAETDIFATADFAVGSGNAQTILSGYTLDTATIGAGNQLRILGKAGGPQNKQNEWGAYTVLDVVFVESIFQNNTSI